MSKPDHPPRSICLIGGLKPDADREILSVLTTRETAETDLAPIGVRYDSRLASWIAPAQDVERSESVLALEIYDGIVEAAARGDVAVVLSMTLSPTTLADLRNNSPLPIVEPCSSLRRQLDRARSVRVARRFKIGVVGGVGPAATIDFLTKLLRHTPATCDQEHLPFVVEQNPQIPDRTAFLLGRGADPTLSLYATCQKLQAGDADLIAIPCNTAHAFIDKLQPRLQVPIENMMTATVEHICAALPAVRRVGLLATTGTLSSGVYQRALAAAGLEQIAPRSDGQAWVMNAIYGPLGVKAGYTSGQCVEDVSAAIKQLGTLGAEAVILGCTELPVILPQRQFMLTSGVRVELIDPTDILAARCVARAMGSY